MQTHGITEMLLLCAEKLDTHHMVSHYQHENAYHNSQVAWIKHTSQITGAVALENIYQASVHRFVNTEVNCSGLEPKITDCIQNLDEAYSCLSLGIASVSCHSMSYNSNYFSSP